MNERYKLQLLSILENHFPKAKIYLFGSQATGKARHGSDIDIALIEKDKVNLSRIFRALNEIEETTIPHKVDLVDFTTAPEKNES